MYKIVEIKFQEHLEDNLKTAIPGQYGLTYLKFLLARLRTRDPKLVDYSYHYFEHIPQQGSHLVTDIISYRLVRKSRISSKTNRLRKMDKDELLKKMDEEEFLEETAELIFLTPKLILMGYPDELIDDVINLIFDTKDEIRLTWWSINGTILDLEISIESWRFPERESRQRAHKNTNGAVVLFAKNDEYSFRWVEDLIEEYRQFAPTPENVILVGFIDQPERVLTESVYRIATDKKCRYFELEKTDAEGFKKLIYDFALQIKPKTCPEEYKKEFIKKQKEYEELLRENES